MSYDEATAAVDAALDQEVERKFLQVLAGGHNTVPTEVLAGATGKVSLSHGSTTSASISKRRPGCCYQLLAHFPALVLLGIFLLAAAAGAGLVLLGDLRLSTQDALFEDATHPDVQAAAVRKQFDNIKAGSTFIQPTAGRRLSSSDGCNLDWSAHGPVLGSDAASQAGFFVIEIVYAGRRGQSLLQPEELRQIALIENDVRGWLADADACSTQRADLELCHCLVPDTALNYLFASRAAPSPSSPAASESLIFDGRGMGAAPDSARAQLRCAPALTTEEISTAAAWLIGSGRGGFFSTGAARGGGGGGNTYTGTGGAVAGGIANASAASSVKYMRTRLTLPVDRWLEIRDQRGIELVELLESSSANSPFVRVYSDFLFWDNSLKAKQLTSTIIHDMVRLVLAIALIFAFMWFYFDYNLALAILAVSQVVLSFPIMAFIVDVVLRQRPLSIFAGCSLFVVTGVSSDNIFVVHETWQRAHALRIDGKRASTAHRVRWTLSQAAKPLFIADVTTAFSLVVNCASPLPAIFQFGLCGGILILVNFVLVLLYMCPLLVLEERGCLRFGRLCLAFHKEGTTHGAGSSRTRLRFQHYVHGALFKARRWLLAATFILVAWLLPASYRLLMKRTGGKVNLLGEVSEPPPGNLEWLGTLTSSGGAMQLTPVPLAGDWPILFHRIRGGIASLDAPLITHNLWPGGASALSALLYIDAFAAAAYACRRIVVGKRALDPTGREVRARRRDLALYAVALLSLLLCAGATLVIIWQRNPHH